MRYLLRWVAMLLAVAAVGSLAIPGHFTLTLKLLAAALGVLVLWFVYPASRKDNDK